MLAEGVSLGREPLGVALAEVESVVPELLAEHGAPGLAVGIFAGGQVATRCFGTLGHADTRPVEPGTLFSVQSVSKLFTVTAVLSLVDAGVI